MDLINLHDYELLAHERLEPSTWAYYSSGAGDESTLQENQDAFRRIKLRPRMLQGVPVGETETTVLNTKVSMPILTAPTAVQGLAHAEGECATARAAGEVGTLMVASTETTFSLEDIAKAASGPLWYQLYTYQGQRQFAESLVHRAEQAGFQALVITVDSPGWGRKDRYRRVGELDRQRLVTGNFAGVEAGTPLEPAALSWDDIAWLRSLTSLPLILKGLLRADDARVALEYGVAAIIVSNHGGRQLDGSVSTIEALPEIVEAVAGRCEVYLDGGIRRGTDVLKALALGAQAVLVGRPILWGLAVDGAEGVKAVLQLLQSDLALSMALAGCSSISSITRDLVIL
ncbi:MAG: alpha-hydroxy acid oxidase [Ktedonobacterales bacterium]